MDDRILGISPVPLHSLREIKQTFRVGNDTVAEWIEEGAPIVRLKNSVHSEYNLLLAWLLDHPGKEEIDFSEDD